MNLPPNGDPNIHILLAVVTALGDLCDSLVFVGGCATGLLVTSVRAQSVRPTDDVDVVAEVLSAHEYHKLEEKVAARGFKHDTSADAPICRWIYDAIKLDLLPSKEGVLGFHNRWYPAVLDTATVAELPGGRQIRLISGPAFLATKLEAFADRGRGDYVLSHDLEDIVTIIDGREGLLAELRVVDVEMLSYISKSIAALLEKTEFMQALPGHLPGDSASQQRLPTLIARLRAIAELKTLVSAG